MKKISVALAIAFGLFCVFSVMVSKGVTGYRIVKNTYEIPIMIGEDITKDGNITVTLRLTHLDVISGESVIASDLRGFVIGSSFPDLAVGDAKTMERNEYITATTTGLFAPTPLSQSELKFINSLYEDVEKVKDIYISDLSSDLFSVMDEKLPRVRVWELRFGNYKLLNEDFHNKLMVYSPPSERTKFFLDEVIAIPQNVDSLLAEIEKQLNTTKKQDWRQSIDNSLEVYDSLARVMSLVLAANNGMLE